jgi:hypothetical protein
MKKGRGGYDYETYFEEDNDGEYSKKKIRNDR